MMELLEALWGSDGSLFGELRFIGPGRDIVQSFHPLDALEDVEWEVATWQGEGLNAYFGVLPRVRASGKAADVVSHTSVLWADVDAKQFTGGKDSALNYLNDFPVPASIIVDSGGGYHAYWLLDQAVAHAEAVPVMRHIAKAVRGDNVHDSPRVLRVPGSHNLKYDPPVLARVMKFDLTRRYRFVDLESLVPQFDNPPPPEWVGSRGDLTSLAAWVAELQEGNRNNGLFWAAATAFEDGVPHGEAMDAFLKGSTLEDWEVMRTVNSAYRRGT